MRLRLTGGDINEQKQRDIVLKEHALLVETILQVVAKDTAKLCELEQSITQTQEVVTKQHQNLLQAQKQHQEALKLRDLSVMQSGKRLLDFKTKYQKSYDSIKQATRNKENIQSWSDWLKNSTLVATSVKQKIFFYQKQQEIYNYWCKQNRKKPKDWRKALEPVRSLAVFFFFFFFFFSRTEKN